MNFQSGDKIVVGSNQFVVEEIDQRVGLLWVSDKWGGWHEVYMSDVTHVEKKVA